MTAPLRIVQIGLGPLGQMLTPHLLERNTLKLTGAVDIRPELVGTDLGTHNKQAPLDILITDNLEHALQNADVAVVTTVSELERLAPLLEKICAKGVHVVSTCEELSYPWQTLPELSQKIDTLAKANNVSILGTGINPGFLMDFLPTAITGVCRSVDSIHVYRIQDASFRRLPFRQKIGAGLTEDEFKERVKTKKIRHVGLTESMHMMASRLGWVLDRTEDVVEPVITQTEVRGDDWVVSPGHATGVNQMGYGYVGDRKVITLEFRAAVGQTDPQERVHIYGSPEFDLTIPGGINGDAATCSVITNAIPVVASAAPGLRTMVDIAPIACAQ
ncbi:MAG: dihydrodipicolinate reductase [Candidatus Latescibacteria bacterium]|jgi:2,4-diaminopentanoate dehydrogenase|nr:dihydrodipicolinate reductase [Candidatus Latescibacterota bacterium]MBT4140145.1 dihydrodipicolinate reductase [Candidatus Latescibacterota bacterium]MBT5831350.1 dihydrodipicolinate reductase [Candidatus Latescibacterota bacterium]